MPIQPPICLIDDDNDFAQTLAKLTSPLGLRMLTFSTGAAFLNGLQDESFGCVLIRLGEPRFEERRILETLSKRPLSPCVIALIDGSDVPAIVQAARFGVKSFLQKHVASKNELLDAVQTALRIYAESGKKHTRSEQIRARFATLTVAEREIMMMLLRGDELIAIANELKISRRTVDARRARLMTKLDVKNLPELVALAFEHGDFPEGLGARVLELDQDPS